jgi:hypothetical protein
MKIRQHASRNDRYVWVPDALASVDAADHVVCGIDDGIAMIACAAEGSFIQYRNALGDVQRLAAYRPGMPVLLDLRASADVASARAVEGRVTALTRFMTPRLPLRVAVITTDTEVAHLRSVLQDVGRIRILVAVFSRIDEARTWLLAEHAERRTQPRDDVWHDS